MRDGEVDGGNDIELTQSLFSDHLWMVIADHRVFW